MNKVNLWSWLYERASDPKPTIGSITGLAGGGLGPKFFMRLTFNHQKIQIQLHPLTYHTFPYI